MFHDFLADCMSQNQKLILDEIFATILISSQKFCKHTLQEIQLFGLQRPIHDRTVH